MSYVVPLSQALDRAQVGGKAASLALLRAAGLPVPEGFVVTVSAFEASREGGAALLALRPSAAVKREIAAALAALCPAGEPVAVRSSALDEDGPQRSFAGQYESFLCVPVQDVARQVAAVWRSGFTDRVLAYRAQLGVAGPPRAPAVLVQRMADADAAGVAFSADPLAGTPDVVVVHAVPGLAPGLVNGDCDADSYRIDRRGRVLATTVADKVSRWRGGADGAQCVALAPEDARSTTLRRHEARAVAALARRCEQVHGRAQDIEWALERGRLWLLQSRPITVQAVPTEQVIWDNSNIAESYAGVTTPLTFSYIRRNYAQAYRGLSRLAGVSQAQIAAHDDLFERMLGLLRGRVYYNLSSWYTLLALIPGFRFNRRLLDQMLGVRAATSTAAPARAGAGARRWVDAVRIALTIACHHFTLASRVRRFEQRLADALAPPQPPLAERDAARLVAYQHELERRLLTHWDAPLVNDFFLMIFHGILRRLVRAWLGEAPAGLDNRLLCGEAGIVSVEPARRIAEMAHLARADASLVDRLCGAEPTAALADLPPAFAARLHDYLARFGDRCYHELKLESPTLHVDPAPLLHAIGAAARGPANECVPGASLRSTAEQQVALALAGRPLRRCVFAWVLAHSRRLMRGREQLRLARTQAYARARCVFLELGRRLFATGALDSADDVFWLETDELFGFVEGHATTANLRPLVAVRRAEFDAYRKQPAPPDRFETVGAVHLAPFTCAAAECVPTPAGAADQRTGQGCGPGRARGRVRVVRDPQSARVVAGEILVAERTDPGWVMLFPLAAGLIVERGSLLSHAAIVAREMGLPAVVGLAGACNWLADGDEVEVDGVQGTVRRCAAPAGSVPC
jgi:phosphohistidine swiveling domain-containing protein